MRNVVHSSSDAQSQARRTLSAPLVLRAVTEQHGSSLRRAPDIRRAWTGCVAIKFDEIRKEASIATVMSVCFDRMRTHGRCVRGRYMHDVYERVLHSSEGLRTRGAHSMSGLRTTGSHSMMDQDVV